MEIKKNWKIAAVAGAAATVGITSIAVAGANGSDRRPIVLDDTTSTTGIADLVDERNASRYVVNPLTGSVHSIYSSSVNSSASANSVASLSPSPASVDSAPAGVAPPPPPPAAPAPQSFSSASVPSWSAASFDSWSAPSVDSWSD